jgi:hypothetical protein
VRRAEKALDPKSAKPDIRGQDMTDVADQIIRRDVARRARR